jgi:two-component system phosphate regulon sensor histidine kinase PhoR
MQMKLRLQWKLTAFFCASVLIGLFLGYFYLTAQLKSFLDQDLQNNLKRELLLSRSFIDDQIKERIVLEDPHGLARRMGEDLGLRVTIISTEGVVLGDSSLSLDEVRRVENHAGRSEIKDALRSGYGVSRRYSRTVRKYLLYMAVSFGGVESRGISRGVLRFAMPLSEVQLFATGLNKAVLLTLLLVFVLSMGFTYLMSVIITRPLTEMAATARAIAAGDFSRTPSVRSTDELGILAGAIVHMSEQIRERIRDIEEEKARLDAVVASMSEGVMLLDAKGAVLLMNPALRKVFFIDTPPEGRRSIEIIRNSILTEMTVKLLQGKESFVSQEIMVAFPEGKTLQVNGVAVRSSGKLEGAVLVFHDITELRRLEKVRQDFVANVSHELRTPVASIKGYAETLLQGAMDDKKTCKEFLNTIYENSDRLVSLINDLLDLARIQSGRLNIVPVAVDAEALIRRCLAVLEKTVGTRRLDVDIRIASGNSRVMADEARLSQIILNLLDNAVKYTPDGGAITVKAEKMGHKVRFDVVDTGIGIPEEDLPRIFERFYRVDKARSRDQGGTGLGLSIVKHLVQAHGGEVWASANAGKGTTFSFTLPAA